MSTDCLHFSRESLRRTSDDKLLDQLEFIAQKALQCPKGRYGWTWKVGPIEAQKSLDTWIFTSWVRFTRKTAIDEERERLQREQIYEWAAAAGHNARFGANPWVVREKKKEASYTLRVPPALELEVTPLDPEIPSVAAPETASVALSVSSSSLDAPEVVPLSSVSRIVPNHHYNHLYGLDAQVRILLSAVQAAADSDMRNRFHTLLYGDPGTGKTDILLSTASLLGEMGISYLSIDATSTTEAGMRKALLDEDSILPEVVLVEEIEKARHSFHLLLGIMDDRGIVSQMNYRKTASRKVPALVLASANDYDLLKKTDSGALLSRFSNEIYCPRPGREILEKILKREIEKVKGGDLAWIEPTLEFCFDERGISDPRMLKRVCLCGKERLVSGEYQKDLERTMRVEGVTMTTINLKLFE